MSLFLGLVVQGCTKVQGPPPIQNTNRIVPAQHDLTLLSVPEAHITAYKNSPMLIGVVARSESGQPLEYEWTKNGEVVIGQTTNTFTLKTATKKDEGHYSVTIKNSMETQTASVHVTFSPTPRPKTKPEGRIPAMVMPAGASCH